MRDEDDRFSGHRPNALEFEHHQLPRQSVERGERFVHEQNGRIVDETARNCDPLLHSARQLVRKMLGKLLEPDELEECFGLGPAGCDVSAERPDRQENVFHGRVPRHQRRLLKDDPDVAARSGNWLAVDHRRTACRFEQTRQESQQRRLSATRRADYRQKPAAREGDAEVFQRWDASARRRVRHAEVRRD